MRRLTFLAVIVVVIGLAVTEVAMSPTPTDRVMLWALFLGSGLLALVAGWVVPRIAGRSPSLDTTTAIVATAAVGVAAAAVSAAALTMFLDSHDLRLVLVALGFGVALALVLSVSLTRAMSGDLRHLAAVANRIGAGELPERTGIDRRDEVGEVARAVDEMVQQLRAAEAERLRNDAARRELYASVGHDLRTPLTALQLATEAIADGMVDDVEPYLASMQANLSALAALVDDAILLARAEAGDWSLSIEPSDLAEVVDGVVEAVRPLADHAGVDIVIGGSAPKVLGDDSAIARIVRNLLDNAIRHAVSRVTVDIDGNPDRVLLRVADDGSGFDQAFVDRAFEPFTREDHARAGAGTGLGLTIVRILADAIGGDVRIVSSESGAVVEVALRPVT